MTTPNIEQQIDSAIQAAFINAMQKYKPFEESQINVHSRWANIIADARKEAAAAIAQMFEQQAAELQSSKNQISTWQEVHKADVERGNKAIEDLASETRRADKFRAELTACMERNRAFEKGEEEVKRRAFEFEQKYVAANERIKELTNKQ